MMPLLRATAHTTGVLEQRRRGRPRKMSFSKMLRLNVVHRPVEQRSLAGERKGALWRTARWRCYLKI